MGERAKSIICWKDNSFFRSKRVEGKYTNGERRGVGSFLLSQRFQQSHGLVSFTVVALESNRGSHYLITSRWRRLEIFMQDRWNINFFLYGAFLVIFSKAELTSFLANQSTAWCRTCDALSWSSWLKYNVTRADTCNHRVIYSSLHLLACNSQCFTGETGA